MTNEQKLVSREEMLRLIEEEEKKLEEEDREFSVSGLNPAAGYSDYLGHGGMYSPSMGHDSVPGYNPYPGYDSDMRKHKNASHSKNKFGNEREQSKKVAAKSYKKSKAVKIPICLIPLMIVAVIAIAAFRISLKTIGKVLITIIAAVIGIVVLYFCLRLIVTGIISLSGYLSDKKNARKEMIWRAEKYPELLTELRQEQEKNFLLAARNEELKQEFNQILGLLGLTQAQIEQIISLIRKMQQCYKYRENTASVENEILSLISQCRNSKLYQNKKNEVQEILRDCIGFAKAETIEMIITALLLKDNIAELNLDSDYSGVCIMLSKALETEARENYFDRYKEYLTQSNLSIGSWPEALLDSNKEAKENCTIGDFPYICGIFQSRNHRKSSVSASELFMPYASERFHLNRNDTDEELKLQVRYMELIRKKYRNPSAHTGRITKQEADECIDQMLLSYKIIQRISLTWNGICS